MTIVLGIDPGLSGGLALITEKMVLFVSDVPSIGEHAKRRVWVPKVLEFLRQCEKINHAFIERAQAMPDQGASSGFIYGRAVGALEACIEGMLIPHSFVEASGWKRHHNLIKTDKEASRQRALQLYPACADLDRKKDHNRAEAILIARYGLETVLRRTAA